ncbi:MAG: hypothetical protein H8E17_20685 [Deltaproteobacteria bacterium]|nr:hypothetical protein [Deltaproteobacteria bacterium]
MKLRYMIDSILIDPKAAAPEYRPVGVWVQGPGPGLDIEMFYPNSSRGDIQDRREQAEWVINRLVENDVLTLPDDFLEYHRQSRSPYDGVFSEQIDTEEYSSITACGFAVLQPLKILA